MNEGHEAKLAHEVEGLLGLARRDLLLLSVATQLEVMDRVAVIAARLRSTLTYAQQLSSQSSYVLQYFKPRLTDLERAATTWLPSNLGERLESTDGKLVIADLMHAQQRVEKIFADNTLLAGFDLDGLALMLMSVQHATLSYVNARRALLDSLQAANAHIHHASFNEARVRLATFDGAHVEDSSLQRANLEGTSWRGARIHRCSFVDALLGDARLDHAQFVDCDLRNADLQSFPDRSNRGLVFVRCDLRRTGWHARSLRGASFIDCRLHGIFGGVDDLDQLHIERADVSPDGDQSIVVDKQEAIRHWRQDFRAAAPSSASGVNGRPGGGAS